MSLICFVSAHGAPGVTTTAAVTAGVWPNNRRRVLVEADPFGGMMAARYQTADSPGLVSLAAAGRRRVDTELVCRHTQQLPGDVPVLIAPATADHAHAVVSDIAAPLGTWAAETADVDVVVDCGRLSPPGPHIELLRHADRVLMLARPSVDQLRPVSGRLATLSAAGISAHLILVGEKPYGPGEVESALDTKVAGVVAWDPAAAAALNGTGGRGKLGRSLLVRSVASFTAELITSFSDEPAVGVGT